MKLLLERVQKDSDVTIGSLSIDGDWEAWTCEDTVRAPGVKVQGQTAIPFGTYAVDITFSPRFQQPMPLLVNVHGFDGIRIHPGNGAVDTDGCILVGHDRFAKSIGHSRMAYAQLFTKLSAAKKRGEAISIEIV